MNENKTYFANVASDSKKIGYKDILSNIFNKHSRMDLDRIFTNGLYLNDSQTGSLLDGWQKPWVFSRVLLYGIIAWVLTFSINAITMISTSNSVSFSYIPIGAGFIIPCCVIPFAISLFFWEMNIPRNIPFYDLFKFLIAGGLGGAVISNCLTLVFGQAFLEEKIIKVFIGALSEELTKLFIIAFFLRKREHCWGLNGLLIGAAVGGGFAIFETNGYAVWSFFENASGISNAFSAAQKIFTIRGIGAICGHGVLAAPYGCALALAKGKQEIKPKHLFDRDVIICFSASALIHFCWNYQDAFIVQIAQKSQYLANILSRLFVRNETLGITISAVIFSAVCYAIILWIMRKALRQVVKYDKGHPTDKKIYECQIKASDFQNNVTDGNTSAKLYILCEAGILSGQTYIVEPGKTIMFGRNQNLDVCFPEDEKGISRVHCSVTFNGYTAILVDKNSSHGTFTSSGEMIQSGCERTIQNGDSFYLASSVNTFRIDIR